MKTEGLDFTIYRRQCTSPQEGRPFPEAPAHKLPTITPDEEKWQSYWVVFEPREAFEPFEFQAEWNADITRRIVFGSETACRIPIDAY